MLGIKQPRQLAARLGVSLQVINETAKDPSQFVQELILQDPREPTKLREVIDITGNLRILQHRIHRRILLPKLIPSEYSHGGVRGKHIKSNVFPHLGSTFAFATDISSFYPSIHHTRVYRLFRELDCAPDVARLLTRLCTHDNHLALGLPTSPILADQIMRVVDERIGCACKCAGLVYSRFVDDITISGNYSLAPTDCGVPKLIAKILGEHGLAIQRRKHRHGRLADGFTITSLVIRNGHIDVSGRLLEQLEAQFADARALAMGLLPIGLYYTYSQLRGRIEFVAWINRSRRAALLKKLRSIDWASVSKNAQELGLKRSKPKLIRKNPEGLGMVTSATDCLLMSEHSRVLPKLTEITPEHSDVRSE